MSKPKPRRIPTAVSQHRVARFANDLTVDGLRAICDENDLAATSDREQMQAAITALFDRTGVLSLTQLTA